MKLRWRRGRVRESARKRGGLVQSEAWHDSYAAVRGANDSRFAPGSLRRRWVSFTMRRGSKLASAMFGGRAWRASCAAEQVSGQHGAAREAPPWAERAQRPHCHC